LKKKVEREVKVSDGEPGKNELDKVVNELDGEQKLLDGVVTGRVNFAPVQQRMQCSEE
jgi:hypothetical protein